MFKEDDDAPAPRPALRENRSETQLVSSMDADALGGSMASTSSKASAAVPRLNSKYAGLKRRAGTASGSQLTALDELGADNDDLDLPPLKKVKSFDPDVESAMSQAAAKRRERQQQEALSNIAEAEEQPDEGFEASKRATATDKKRKNAPTSAQSDDEAQGARKKATTKSTDSTAAKIQKGAATQADAAERPKEERYLQVKTGRKRVTKDEAGFNEEFNKLKIQRPLLPVSKKMGWNERDIVQEELEEEDDGFLKADDKATFFQIKYVSMARKKPVVPVVSVDPKYAGKPNFKAFRPKTTLNGTRNSAAVQEKRKNIKLVLAEPLGYGLKESYRADKDDSDPDEEIEMPMGNTQKKRAAPKAKAKAATAPPAKKVIPGRRNKKNIIDESDEEEDELEDDTQSARSSTVREDSRPPPAGRKARTNEPITLDSDSSDDGCGKRFAGECGS